MVNEFLLSKAIDDGVLELGTDAHGLAHYFSFVLDKQAEWDAEYDEGDFDPLYDDPVQNGVPFLATSRNG